MSKAVVFISYRFEGDAARAKALSDALKATGSIETTFSLEDLRKGDEWKPQLYRWLARCDAGLVLITPNMLDKPGWVLQEATILRARNILEPGHFPLFVLIDPAARTHANWPLFAPLDLHAIQLPPAGVTDDALAAMVQERTAHLADDDADDYFRRLQSLIGDQLQPFLGLAGLVKQLHKQLDEADEHWQTLIGGESALPGALSQRICEGRATIGSYSGLHTLLQVFKNTGLAEHRRNLLAALRPYWVSLGAASQLACAQQRPPGQRLCVVETGYPVHTPALYVDRFYGPYRNAPEVWGLSAGNESVDELAGQMVRMFNETYRAGAPPVDEDAVRQGLEAFASQLVVVLPPAKLSRLARGLAARFPAPLYIVPVEHGTPTGSAEWSGFERLVPVKPQADEDALFQQFNGAANFAK